MFVGNKKASTIVFGSTFRGREFWQRHVYKLRLLKGQRGRARKCFFSREWSSRGSTMVCISICLGAVRIYEGRVSANRSVMKRIFHCMMWASPSE